MLRAALFVALAACDADSDGDAWPPWPTWGEAGTVYVCPAEPDEWCYAGPVAELEAMVGATCHPIEPSERLWPALTGCRYACPPEGRGCNARNGCACEASP
jgi:hypothetical protein